MMTSRQTPIVLTLLALLAACSPNNTDNGAQVTDSDTAVAEVSEIARTPTTHEFSAIVPDSIKAPDQIETRLGPMRFICRSKVKRETSSTPSRPGAKP